MLTESDYLAPSSRGQLSSFNSDIFSVENENALELAELPLPPPPPELLSMSLLPLPTIPERDEGHTFHTELIIHQ